MEGFQKPYRYSIYGWILQFFKKTQRIVWVHWDLSSAHFTHCCPFSQAFLSGILLLLTCLQFPHLDHRTIPSFKDCHSYFKALKCFSSTPMAQFSTGSGAVLRWGSTSRAQTATGGGSNERQVGAQLQVDGAPDNSGAPTPLTTTQPPNLSETYPHQPISTFAGSFSQACPWISGK